MLSVVTALSAGAACSSSEEAAARGTALAPEHSLSAGIRVTPGDAWSYMIASVKNGGADGLNLQRVDLLPATGSGQVAVGPAKVGPVPSDADAQPHGWTPSGVFKTNPPTLLIPGGNCNIQHLAPVQGYELDAGETVRFAFVMFSRSSGTTTFPGFRVTYSQGGTTFEQTFPTGLVVTSREGRPLPMGYAEKPCAYLAPLLPSGA